MQLVLALILVLSRNTGLTTTKISWCRQNLAILLICMVLELLVLRRNFAEQGDSA